MPRRGFLKAGLGGAGLIGAAAMSVGLDLPRIAAGTGSRMPPGHHGDPMPGVVGEVDHAANGFNPTAVLTDSMGAR